MVAGERGVKPLRRALLAIGIGLLAAASAQAESIGLSPNEALHQSLRLDARQEVLWTAYRAATGTPGAAQARRSAASALFPTLDAPHRMDLVAAELRQELTDVERQSNALKAFYAALSPGQQRTFDAGTLPRQTSQQP